MPGWGMVVQSVLRRLRQRKYRQHATELGVVGQRLVGTDRAQAGRVFGEAGREADTGPAADAGKNGNVLLAVVLIGVDVADDAGRSLEPPELLAGIGIDRLDVAFERSVEDDVAGRGERAAPYRERLRIRPLDLAGAGIPGDEVAEGVATGGRIHAQCRTDVWLARGVADAERLIVHADVVGRHVEQFRLRRIGRRLLVLRTEGRRADALRVDVFAVLVGRILRHDFRASGRHVDMRRPVHGRIVLLGHQQGAAFAVQRVAEAVAVEVDEGLVRLAADIDIREDHLVDAVEVPFVMGRHLVHPFRHAGVGVAGED